VAKTTKKERDESSVRNIFALGFVSFFTDISSEMVFSILPTFLLGLPGSSVAVLGFIEGTAEALSYALRAVSGIFSDKFRKRKIFVLAGYAISNVVKPFFAVARAPFDVLVIRVADALEKLFGLRHVMRFWLTLFLRNVEEPRLVCIGH
jgi:hypothetical protein